MWTLKEGLNAFNSEIHNEKPSSSSKVISKTNIANIVDIKGEMNKCI